MVERHIDYAEIAVLPLAERIALAQQLWNDIHDELEAAPFTPGQLKEIQRRGTELDAGRMEEVPAADVFRRLDHE